MELSDRVKNRWQAMILEEIGRARLRVRAVQKHHPGDSRADLARRLVRAKQRLAATTNATAGLFGWLTLPADLAFSTYLALGLIVDIAVLHGVNLKTPRAQHEVFEILGYANAGARKLFGGLPRLFARAVPLVASPVSLVHNRKNLARVGETALRFYGSFNQLPARKG